ncbi:hypothetical protein ZIOFF_039500 [Zingiber officinale]|uniref:Uncharacterized protein n=1 Tax=Zingiber officinale TaxID=94328 RepID=A0A8J5G764_ZINOF|nr:hypothetical protein ZIOFF_039500 [Zingiber officinale]
MKVGGSAEMFSERRIQLKRVMREGVQRSDASKSTPLHFAAASGDAVMLLLLLQRDASAGFLQDEEGLAIIHIAASVGSLNLIKEILAYCPDALEQKNNKRKQLCSCGRREEESKGSEVRSQFFLLCQRAPQ